jgi:hypothetical protein
VTAFCNFCARKKTKANNGAGEHDGKLIMADRLFSSDQFQSMPDKSRSRTKVVVWAAFLFLVLVLLLWRARLVPTTQEASVPLYELGTRLDFTQVDNKGYLGAGWYGPETDRQWAAAEGVVKFRLATVEPLRLRMSAFTLKPKQKFQVRLNDRDLGQREGTVDEATVMEFDLPVEALQEINTLTLVVPDACSPQSLNGDPDSRILGVGMVWMELDPLK